jgi:hypothetical protein
MIGFSGFGLSRNAFQIIGEISLAAFLSRSDHWLRATIPGKEPSMGARSRLHFGNMTHDPALQA